jgi:hypothetical protein
MSWIDKVNNIELEIITGDGQSFKPLWKDAKKNINFNTEGFDFVDLDGTYVERKRKSGNQYPFLIYFQGEDHLEQCEAFERSSADPRPWTLIHPFYGKLTVQPLGLDIDHSVLNVSKITGTIWETITLDEVDIDTSPLETIKSINIVLTNDISKIWADMDVVVQDVEPSLKLNVKIGTNFKKLPLIPEEFAQLQDVMRTASGAAQNLVSDITSYVDATINLILFPLIIKENILFSINTLVESFESIYELIFNENPKSYESMSSLILGTICENAVLSASAKDINLKRSDIYDIATILNDLYDDFITNMDTLEANHIIAMHLDNLINTTLASLVEIAFTAKQERSTILVQDTNIIILADKYYGQGDDKLQEFIDNNQISLDELIEVKAGKRIYWYV